MSALGTYTSQKLDDIISEINGLDLCKTKADALSILVSTNMEIINYNKEQDKKFDAAYQIWKERSRRRTEEQENWTESYIQEYDKSSTQYRLTNKKGDISFDTWCREDFGEDWIDNGVANQGIKGDERRYCKMTVAAREKLSKDKTVATLGVQKSDLNEPEPMKSEFIYKKYVDMDTNINCCTDIATMVPEKSSDKYLSSISKCITNISVQKDKSLIDKKNEEEVLRIKKKQDDEAAEIKKKQDDLHANIEKDKNRVLAQENSLKYIILLVVIVLISSSISGSFFMFKTSQS